MTTVAIGYSPVWTFLGNDGRPLAGGLLTSYGAGSNTLSPTFIDSTGVQQNTNPIVLNSRGDTANQFGVSCGVWWPPGTALKFVLTDAAGNPIWSQDNVTQPISTSLPAGIVTDASLAPSSVIYAIDQTYMRTSAEITAGVTPTNYGYAPGWVPRYMSASQLADWLAGTAAISQITAFTAAYNVAMAGTPHGFVYAPAGKYLIPSPGLNWTNQNDIRFYGDGPNSTHIEPSGNNYTVLTVSADTGAGTTGTNLFLSNFGIGTVGALGTNVNAVSCADYLFFNFENLQLYSSGNSLKLAGMAQGTVTNLNALTAGTNAAGNSCMIMTVDTDSVPCGPITFNNCFFNGNNNITAGGAVWSNQSFAIQFNSPTFIALGPTLTSVFAATNNDDITVIEGYSESSRNTTADTAVLYDLGSAATVVNFSIKGGTYFQGAGGHTLNYAVNASNIQALHIEDVLFVSSKTAAVKYTASTVSLIELKNVRSSGAGNPPVLDSSVNGPSTQYLMSWRDPYPFVDISLVTPVGSVTGDGTAYTVLFDTVQFDRLTMYNSGTGKITIPAQRAGLYAVSASVIVNSLTASFTNMEMDIIQKTSGGAGVTTVAAVTNPGAVKNAANQAWIGNSCLLSCSGGDVITVVVTVSGSTKSIGVAGAATQYTRFTAQLVS